MSSNRTKSNRTLRKRQREFARYAHDHQKILDIGLYYYNKSLVEQKADSQAIYGFDIRRVKPPAGYDYFVQGDVQEISKHFEPDFFDLILLGEVIEHVTNPYQTINELSKILKNGGLLVLSTPNPHGFPLLFIEWLSIKKFFYANAHTFLFPPRWLRRILESNNLRVIKQYGQDFFFALRVPLPLAYIMFFIAQKDDKLPKQYQPAHQAEKLIPK